FGHERLTKAHDFSVGFPLGIEVRAALTAAHGQTRERVFKNLFEREKLNDAGGDCRMKTQASFVRPERAVHLHAEPAVNLNLAFVIDPGNAELNHPLRFNKALKDLSVSIFLVTFDHWPDRFQHFSHRLKELRLVGVTLLNNFENLLHQAHKGVTSAGYLL